MNYIIAKFVETLNICDKVLYFFAEFVSIENMLRKISNYSQFYLDAHTHNGHMSFGFR